MKREGFWSRGVTAFFDVRVTHVNSKCNQGKATSTIFKEQQEEKSGSTNRECWTLKWDLSLSQFLKPTVGWEPTATAFSNAQPRSSQKRRRNLITFRHITITWIKTLISFEILRSVHTCLSGSRHLSTNFHKGDFIDDCRLNASQACVR